MHPLGTSEEKQDQQNQENQEKNLITFEGHNQDVQSQKKDSTNTNGGQICVKFRLYNILDITIGMCELRSSRAEPS